MQLSKVFVNRASISSPILLTFVYSPFMKRRRHDPLQEKITEPPKFIIDGSFRRVQPYYFEYSTFAKERWYGRSLLDVFATDFKDKPSYYYKNAISNSLITVNAQSIGTDYLVKPNDIISHLIHRHEPPVLNRQIQIIFEDSDLLVVDKPPSVPCHPSGRYNHNTLVSILKHERGYDHLSVINRLDRLTSGIVILAKNNESACRLHQKMEDGVLSKEYICMVEGDFPSEIDHCDAPIKTASFKLGLNVVAPDGKQCMTKFTKLYFDGTNSFLKAMPITGRTHQIRVHLQHLGFPIINDPLYNNSFVWKDRKSSNGNIQQVIDYFLSLDNDEYGNIEFQAGDGDTCIDCLKPKKDPVTDSLYLCLHAYKYSGPGFAYETGYPEWTKSINHSV